ncbi:MAG: hypothetical protein EOR63_32145 [Mesorhizobium sp.]|nr:MAG: hypothetical protein EOR63_32145 [Mesorhizobium sp.]
MTRKVFDPIAALQMAKQVHVIVLDALMTATAWSCEDAVFHGGTSLHLSWRSPRYSEDLDFLIARDIEGLDEIMGRIHKIAQERIAAFDPRYAIEIRTKTRDATRMPSYQVVLTHPEYMGKILVKVEFWRVDREYLSGYPSTFRTPLSPGDIVSTAINPVPVATLETAFSDKLTAFATRPYLKWRDVYDLWWIGTQTEAKLDFDAVTRQMLHNLSAYDTVGGKDPADVLREFSERDPAALAAAADPDLKRWLPENLWKSLYPNGIREIVAFTQRTLATVADRIDRLKDETGPRFP